MHCVPDGTPRVTGLLDLGDTFCLSDIFYRKILYTPGLKIDSSTLDEYTVILKPIQKKYQSPHRNLYLTKKTSIHIKIRRMRDHLSYEEGLLTI